MESSSTCGISQALQQQNEFNRCGEDEHSGRPTVREGKDEKDLKIRELSTELHRERKRSAAYQEQLQMILKYVEEHTRRLSLNVQVDEKDKRIRELSLELYNERQKCKRRCAVYEEQLNMILKDLEKHTEHISNKVADIVQSIKEIEEKSEESDADE
ncbi:hypothetical protein TEA_007160 [Camellia sinensis var. sinensis]|uniref:Uncharacterized protein n=1 Tax=Camellia sinensis var. sinensis TaxID=542762 RepID=A0A4S4CY05_CAMSN|nr:hypothetical protein TEA_007160 [Camellia sinensis var. sinensis]